MKERYIILLVLLLAIVALGVALIIPGEQRSQFEGSLPWQAKASSDGGLTVFGLTLGRSTLNEARRLYREEVKVSLFATDEGEIEIEGYFDTLDISGLRAKMVLGVEVEEAARKAMFMRGVRIATLGSGTRKVTLASDDLATVLESPIGSITYLPKSNIDPDHILDKFGEPSERIAEPKGGIEHWLYPEIGLDIVVSTEDKEVFQYVMPRRFSQLYEPLKAAQVKGNDEAQRITQ